MTAALNPIGFDPDRLGEIQEISLEHLQDESAQTRANRSEEAVERYRELIAEGHDLGHAEAYWDGQRLRLAAGFTRKEAYRRAGRASMPCVVFKGGLTEAVEAGVRSNSQHGVQTTLADRHLAVEMLLTTQPNLSLGVVAKKVGCCRQTVANIKAKMATVQFGQSRVGLDGRSYRTPEALREHDTVPFDGSDEPDDNDELTDVCDNLSQNDNVKTPKSPGQPKAPSGGTSFDPSEWTPSEVKDGRGREVTGDLRQVFEIVGEFQDQRNKLAGIKSWLTQRVKHPAGALLAAAQQRLSTDINHAGVELKFSTPYCECVYCHAKPQKKACVACKGIGWMTKVQFENVPSEFRNAEPSVGKAAA